MSYCIREVSKLHVLIIQRILLLILVDNIHSTVIHIPNPLDTREPDYTVVLRLIKNLRNFPLILHFDNQSHNNELLSELNHEVRCRYTRNYDMQASFHRAYDDKYIHIVNLSNLAEFVKKNFQYENSVSWNIIVFLVRQKPPPQLILNKLSPDTGIFVVRLADSKLFSCSHSIQLEVKCTLEETEIEETSSNSISTGFTMEGMNFRVGYLTDAPYVYQRAYPNGTIKIIGSEVKLLDALSELKHFRYKLIGVNHNNGSEYSTMLKNLENGSVLWAIGAINHNINRTRKYDFMKYIRLQGLTAMFYRIENTHPMIALSKSHSFQWIILLVVLCMISLFLMEQYHQKRFGDSENDKIVYILIIITPLIEQVYPLRRMFRKNPVKFVLLIWWFSCCLVSLIFKIYLLNSFICSSHKSMTMLDLIRDGYRFESTENDYWYLQLSCTNSPECIGVKKRFTFGDLCQSSSTMKSEKLAIIGEKHALRFKVLRECKKLSAAEKFKITFADDNFFGAECQTWAMRKHSMITLTFSKIVSRMEAAGILEKWARKEIDPKYFIQEKMARATEKETYSPLDLKIVSTAFILLNVGFLISLLVFLVELLVKKKRVVMEKCAIIQSKIK